MSKMKRFCNFISRNKESFLVGTITNLISPIITSVLILLIASSNWFGVTFLDQRMPISCEAKMVSNENMFLYDVTLTLDWRNRSELSSIIFYGKSDSFFILDNSLANNAHIRLKRRLGLESDNSFYGAEMEVFADPPSKGSSELKFQVRSQNRIKERKCDLFAFSEY